LISRLKQCALESSSPPLTILVNCRVGCQHESSMHSRPVHVLLLDCAWTLQHAV